MDCPLDFGVLDRLDCWDSGVTVVVVGVGVRAAMIFEGGVCQTVNWV